MLQWSIKLIYVFALSVESSTSSFHLNNNLYKNQTRLFLMWLEQTHQRHIPELFLQDISICKQGWAGDQWILYWGCWVLWDDYQMWCQAVNRQWQRVWVSLSFQPVTEKKRSPPCRSSNSEVRPCDHHSMAQCINEPYFIPKPISPSWNIPLKSPTHFFHQTAL